MNGGSNQLRSFLFDTKYRSFYIILISQISWFKTIWRIIYIGSIYMVDVNVFIMENTFVTYKTFTILKSYFF